MGRKANKTVVFPKYYEKDYTRLVEIQNHIEFLKYKKEKQHNRMLSERKKSDLHVNIKETQNIKD